MPGGPRCRSLPGSPRCRQALVAGRPFSGGHILEKGPPRDRPRRCSKSFILWQNLTWQNPASISRIQVCLTSRPSLPGCPRCREALVAGRPSLRVVAGKRCREALVAGRPSLPGGPRCREPSLPGGPRCRAFSWPFSGLFWASSGLFRASSGLKLRFP